MPTPCRGARHAARSKAARRAAAMRNTRPPKQIPRARAAGRRAEGLKRRHERSWFVQPLPGERTADTNAGHEEAQCPENTTAESSVQRSAGIDAEKRWNHEG